MSLKTSVLQHFIDDERKVIQKRKINRENETVAKIVKYQIQTDGPLFSNNSWTQQGSLATGADEKLKSRIARVKTGGLRIKL